MNKHLNIFILTVFAIGQLILGPIGMMTAYAESELPDVETDAQVSADESVESPQQVEPTDQDHPAVTEEPAAPVEPAPETGTQQPEQEAEPADKDADETTGTDPPGQPKGEATSETPKADGEPEDEATEEGEDRDAEEEEDGAKSPEGNKTGFHLVLDKATQGPKDEPFSEANPLNPMNEFFVHYKWSLDDGHGYKAGDTVSFQLPKQLNILAAADGELADDFGTLFANYHVATNGTVTFTFTEAVTQLSDIKGDFFMKSKLKPSETEINDGKVTIEPMEEGGHIDIPVNTGNMAANISKAGTPLPAFSPKEIEWTITVDSKMLKHKDGKVTDFLPPGLTFKPGTVKINGQESVDPTIDGKNLSFNLGDFSGTKTITFMTTIDQENWSDKTFYNKATYEAEKVDPIEAGASVTINRGNPLVKKPGSYDSKTRTITWTIEMNYDSQDLVNTKLVDTWDAGSMDFVEGSVVVSEMKLDEGGNASLVGVSDIPKTVTSSANGITIDFPKVDKPYKITYQTKLKERPTENSKIKNNVSWNGHTSGNEVSVTQGVLTKHVGAPNYKDKTVKWWFKANSDRQELKNIVLSDKFATPGLTMKENSLVVKVGNKVIAADNYTVQYNVQGQAFVLTFNPEFKTNQEIIVEFETHFDYAALKAENQTEFKNTGKITSTDYEGNKHKDREAYQVLPMDDFTKHDGNKSGSYDARDKTITWTIGVNYQQNAHEELIVKDFIQGNQKLLPDTIKVSEGVLGGGNNSISAGDEIADANVTKPEVDGKPGFSVNLGKTDKAYVITYKTSLKDLDYIEKNYKNTANVFDGTTKLTDLPADVGITQGGQYGGKAGTQNGKAIDWTVTVNASQATVQDVVLTDTLSANQEFLQDTIKVYATTVDNFGNVTKGAAYDNVTIDVTEEANETEEVRQTLTVKFNEAIDRPYIVEYSTLYFAGHNEIVSNDYKVTGSNIGDKGQQGGTESVTIDQSTGGSGSGKVGYLQVNKIASDDENKVFEGIEFQLIDEKTGKVLKTGVTDKDGNIDFGRLMFGNYLLKETKAPEGYITPTEAYKVTINKEYIKGDTEKVGNVETIVNNKEIKQIEIGKYEPSGSWLAGAEFMIKNDKGEVVEENLVTDENGKVTSKELPVGTYTLVETKAPVGYQKLKAPIEFTIEAGKAEPVVKDVPNIPFGAVSLHKVGKDLSSDSTELVSLPGVKFNLLKEENGDFVKVNEEALVTDQNGLIVVKDLEDGNYRFAEIATIEGYKMLSEKEQAKLTFTIKNGELAKTVTEQVVALFKESSDFTFTVENEVDDETTKLVKHDAKDETKLLKGAQFKVYKKDDAEAKPGEEVKKGQVYTTDDNGEIIIKDLPYGHYYYVETKAPSGYRIDRTPVPFEVKKDAYVITKIGNKKRSGGGGGGGTPPPVDPTDPDPTDPTDPENPDPTDPTDPENPDPTDPTDPENPDPTDPTDPTTPTDPENPDPTDPTDPTTPTDPDENENPEDVTNNPNDPNSPKDPNEGEHGDGVTNNGGKHPNKPNTDGAGKLPQTGEELYVVMMFGGMALVLIGSVLVFRRRVS
ncbi:LPXTG cell wall anchor domain-containing protein [Savagea sp. SN6]|uniref:LPXTG cell wall anchor domain-containing protein n=1 Tax=Savagea serpentis TaxID=2785297 RepID=A0A8J7GAT1_9BACL|nr:SpaA isopeptide-forming pilin-related protein [Savagea serpentis]MBF4501165.1 LPXTG cell wall anchor domain-containing protein [Savagea serpentis]